MAEEKQNIEQKKEVVVKSAEKTEKKKIFARGKDSPISSKHSIAICRMIKNKKPNEAIKMLEEVIAYKRAVPMTGELPHRKGMCSGRYPINASKEFIKMLKNLNANTSNSGVDSSELIIHASSNLPSRRRSSRKARHFKRTDVLIELKQK